MQNASSLEIYLLELMNAERIAHGLSELTLERNLNQSAAAYSHDLLTGGHFSHTGADSSTPRERIETGGFDLSGSWSTGENLAARTLGGSSGWMDDVAAAHRAIMDSPGHRANILSETFTHVGIGIEGGRYAHFDGRSSLVVTQNFGRTSGDLDEQMIGGSGRNILRGEGGEDHLSGKGGNDALVGGAGRDVLLGHSGNDALRGGAGADTIRGGTGDDLVHGGRGQDLIYLGTGNDRFEDAYEGGASGRDTVFGGGGDDRMIARGGNDVLKGQDGDDLVRGGFGNDVVQGGRGRDNVAGQQGNDQVWGGAGADVFVFRDGHDRFRDFDPDQDRLKLDNDLWEDDLGLRKAVQAHAEITERGVLLDFGDDSILFEDVTDVSALVASIDVI